MTNRQLRGWYHRYGRKYFGGKLPEIYVRYAKLPGHVLGWSTRIGEEWVGIELNQDVRRWPRLSRNILLHEMVHISLSRKVLHGPRFNKEMLRLAKAGAFWGIW